METVAVAGMVTLVLACLVASGQERAKSDDPCGDKSSNAEMRECYGSEQKRVSAEADSLANKIAVGFRKEARDPAYAGVDADILQKGAAAVVDSQKAWKAYRDMHCRAVQCGWTSGSGAGTAYESCMFELGKERLANLRSSFGDILRNGD